jgi:hypothetical protein
MASDLESESSSQTKGSKRERPGWVKVGIFALASALAGGLAAAWWYRKTLDSLQAAEDATDNPHFRILDE